MEQLSFKLEAANFEGPLDLLLHLISKHKLNIYDIPIMLLVEQYLAYIESMALRNMEIAGEFLEMAARLIYIKTVSLLPSYKEAEELKKELEGRLIEYSLCKKAAEIMKGRYNADVITVRNPIAIEIDNTYSLQHEVELLLAAYAVINANTPDKPLKSEMFTELVSKAFVSVNSKIIRLLRILYKSGECYINDLFGDLKERSDRVAMFLAVLELTKSGRTVLNEENTMISFNKNYTKQTQTGVIYENQAGFYH
ncbi:MAG: segregation/condensation protein A [Oscillospiraceae bacterium]|nr:segregation/condensation protein A [Oscillospiraceae bacterium]